MPIWGPDPTPIDTSVSFPDTFGRRRALGMSNSSFLNSLVTSDWACAIATIGE